MGTKLELKFAGIGLRSDGCVIEGYASRFGVVDKSGDVVRAGAFVDSLARIATEAVRVPMLWQHDPEQPIGVWDALCEDGNGLWVRGRLLPEVARAREAAALIDAGAIDGLSIGYRVVQAQKAGTGRRDLIALDLWEVSLVTFPMLPQARLGRVPVRRDGLVQAFKAAAQELRVSAG